MANENDVLAHLGGRKFVAFVLGLLALVAVACLVPSAFNTELVTGVVGLVAVFSGSNALSTIQAIKAGKSGPAEPAKEDEEVPVTTQQSAEFARIEAKLEQIEQLVSGTGQATLAVQNMLTLAMNAAPKR
jgi:hypothetical protein